MTWNCSYPKSVIERKIMSLFSPNKWGLLEAGRSHMLSKVRKKSGPKPRRNTCAGKVRRAPLPCFCRAFEPTTLVGTMVKHRDLRIEEKSNHHLSSFLVGLVWSDSCARREDQNTQDPTRTGSRSNSPCAALFHILLQKAGLAKKPEHVKQP